MIVTEQRLRKDHFPTRVIYDGYIDPSREFIATEKTNQLGHAERPDHP